MRIPKVLEPAIVAIAGMDVNTAEMIGVSLAQIEPGLSFEEVLASLTKNNPNVNIDSGENLLRFLFFVHNVLLEVDVEQELMLSDISDTSKKEILPDLNIALFNQNCRLLLHSESCLRILAKALVISHDYAKGFRGVEIISDVRPVFVRKASPLKYSIVRHILNIEYWAGTERSEIYLSLDSKDLAQLQKSIAGAIENDSSITNHLREMDGCVLDLNSDFDTDIY